MSATKRCSPPNFAPAIGQALLATEFRRQGLISLHPHDVRGFPLPHLSPRRYDSADWTTQTDRREDRKEYSDWTDEDTGFAEVIALEKKPHEQAIAPASWRNPRTWLEWNDKRGKLRLMCGVYHLADGKPLSYYDMVDGSVIHPLYERSASPCLSLPGLFARALQLARACCCCCCDVGVGVAFRGTGVHKLKQ